MIANGRQLALLAFLDLVVQKDSKWITLNAIEFKTTKKLEWFVWYLLNQQIVIKFVIQLLETKRNRSTSFNWTSSDYLGDRRFGEKKSFEFTVEKCTYAIYNGRSVGVSIRRANDTNLILISDTAIGYLISPKSMS